MRQGNGTDLLGMNDPRSTSIGVIYVSPNDDRKSVLAAILTQEKLDRKQVLIVLPDPNKAFARPQDFDDLKSYRRKLQAQLIFIAPVGPGPAEFARQRRFAVYNSLDQYKAALLGEETPALIPETDEKKRRFFGARNSKALDEEDAGPALAAGAGAVVAAQALSSQPQNQPKPQQPQPQAPLDSLDDDDALDASPSSFANPGQRLLGNRPNQPTPPKTPPQDASAPVKDVEDYPTVPFQLGTPPLPSTPAATNQPQTGNQGKSTSPQTPGVVSSNPQNAPDGDNENDLDSPGIIELKPLRAPRSTVNLNESPAAVQAKEISSNPPTRTKKRPTGSMPVVPAVGAAALGVAAASAASSSPTNQIKQTSKSSAATFNQGKPTGKGHTAPLPIVANASRFNAGSPPPQSGNTGGPGKRRRRPLRWLVLLIVLLLLTALIGGSVFAYARNPKAFQENIVQPISNVVPGANATATVNLTPASKELRDKYVMLALSKTPDPKQLQVSLDTLESAPPTQTKQVNGTGKTKTAATYATGTVILYNFNDAPQTIIPTTFTITGSGIQFRTTRTVTIPGANGDVYAQTTVSASAVVAGSSGNIAAGSFNAICCAAGVKAKNNAFGGGRDSLNYSYVQKSDVDSAAQPLLTSLSKQAKDDFNKKLKSNERLVGDPDCTATPGYDDSTVGDKGRNITSTQITVSARCTGLAYDHKGAQDIARTRLQNKAATEAGLDYKLVGDIVTDITDVNKQNQSVSMLVNARGTWTYQVSEARKAELARLIAGKKVSEATTLLKGQTGVGDAKIDFKGGDTLPTDVKQITINLLNPPGSSGTGGGNGTPTPTGPVGTTTPGSTPVVTPTTPDGTKGAPVPDK